MDIDQKPSASDLETYARKIAELAELTRSDSHPEELDHIKKLIKKHVPFTLRGYFTAYLLRELSGKHRPPTQKKAPAPKSKPRQTERTKPTEKEAEPQQKRQIPEDAKTLYLNIGKMKRLYVRDLVQILQDELGISKDDVYSVRIHDKYSFITLSDEHAQLALEKLNGKDIKGRTAVLSYSNRDS